MLIYSTTIKLFIYFLLKFKKTFKKSTLHAYTIILYLKNNFFWRKRLNPNSSNGGYFSLRYILAPRWGGDPPVVRSSPPNPSLLTGDGDEFVFEKQTDESLVNRNRLVGRQSRYQRGQKGRTRVGHNVCQVTASILASDHGVRVVQTIRDHFKHAHAGRTSIIFACYKYIKYSKYYGNLSPCKILLRYGIILL